MAFSPELAKPKPNMIRTKWNRNAPPMQMMTLGNIPLWVNWNYSEA